MMAEDHDRITLRFTSDVAPATRALILAAIEGVAEDSDCHVYSHHDTSDDAWSVDITGHDRTVAVELTPGQLIEHLDAIARAKGITVGQLLRRMVE